ncbi:hypothetical protein M409DRAFT_28920 [Zasmidium cellare ATCC 36951]|uniref:Uncharacterized protein n=1 Tax=Zasmidium cellare ATCC 36951 TaxID=1080233 RepID=A0A6A6C570_ZASCE|nr:uncharacterized protein M409DRAFT_28920 [Zasmidium cellare ATCC 36951]KAF2160536.1 hypothetical protein M409DRAFT_28920 [Zasmidium cellare ATCC 36951]
MVLSANRRPNSTSSVTFNFTTASNPNGRQPFTQEWTWLVNITDVSTSDFENPTDITGGGNLENATDPHFTNAVYDFQWPGGEDLNTYLATAMDNATGVGGQLCYATLDLKGLPMNVSSR